MPEDAKDSKAKKLAAARKKVNHPQFQPCRMTRHMNSTELIDLQIFKYSNYNS